VKLDVLEEPMTLRWPFALRKDAPKVRAIHMRDRGRWREFQDAPWCRFGPTWEPGTSVIFDSPRDSNPTFEQCLSYAYDPASAKRNIRHGISYYDLRRTDESATI
jgi:hypothetical protein